jgi:DNA-binding MltR family transcriptional regulator
MVSGTSKRLKLLAKEIPDDRETRALLRALELDESEYVDRSIAIIAASWLEKALEVGILSKFIKLDDEQRKRLFDTYQHGPLADFSARIKIGAALDLFGPKTHDDLERIRVVRNAFAHSPQLLKFSTKEVAAVCNELHLPTTLTLVEGGGSSAGPKTRYVSTAIAITSRIKTRMVSTGNLRFRPNLP